MYNLDVISKGEFRFWFKRRGMSCVWDVFEMTKNINDADAVPLTTYYEESDLIDDFETEDSNIFDEIRKEFNMFREQRPEYCVGIPIDVRLISDCECSDELLEERQYVFEKLLTAVIAMQETGDRGIDYARRCINWLRNGDFYTAPASTRFHEAEPGGLLKHTLKVVNAIYQISVVESFSEVKLHEAVLVALAHDWCKIGTYEMYMRNVKDDATGVWNKVPSYKKVESPIPFGHGTSSMYTVQKFVHLTMEQSLAIRWHMGRWYVSDSEINELQHSNETYPLVHMIQFADQLAITSYFH